MQKLQQQILNADPELDGPVCRESAEAGPPLDKATRDERPAQLPADLATFSGRGAEVEQLLSLAAGDDDRPKTVVVSAIDGMAGIGKTSLAVHAAHEVAGRYEDGQIFLDLHGFTDGLSPVAPGDALDRLLRTIGVAGEQIPQEVDERAALWRTRVAGRRLLIVLDNAADEAHVRPLLPGTADCLVLVMSWRRLVGLDDVHPISLDVLPQSDAVMLFTRIAGAERLAGESDDLVHDVVELCGRLPLALRVAASRLRHRPGWSLADLADRLRDQENRLGELEAGRRSVTVTLDVSYAQLDAEHQRMYRLLGLHPGSDIEPYAAAALADTTVRQAERLLDDLLDVHLLRQDKPGRYNVHDLVRAHAHRLCLSQLSTAQREESLERLFDYYSHTAISAMNVAYPHEADQRRWLRQTVESTRVFPDERTALQWLDTEMPNLLTTADAASRLGHPHVLTVSSTIHQHLRTRGQYESAARLHTAALDASRRLGDRRGEQDALYGLGRVHYVRGWYEQSINCYQRALGIAREAEDLRGTLRSLNGLGAIYFLQGKHGEANASFEEVLTLARKSGDRASQRYALLGCGAVHLHEDDLQQAAASFEEVLAIARSTGDKVGELHALEGLGRAYRLRRHYDTSTGFYRQVLSLARSLGYQGGELNALTGLATVHYLRHEAGPARELFERVLQMADAVGNRNFQFEALHGLGQTYHLVQDFYLAVASTGVPLTLRSRLGSAWTRPGRAMVWLTFIGSSGGSRRLGHNGGGGWTFWKSSASHVLRRPACRRFGGGWPGSRAATPPTGPDGGRIRSSVDPLSHSGGEEAFIQVMEAVRDRKRLW